MKKKLFGISIVAAVALMAGWNLSTNNNNVKLSDLTLNNVEALAGAECTTNWSCWLNPNTRACCNKGTIGCAPCD